jgi:hypothetical protein
MKTILVAAAAALALSSCATVRPNDNTQNRFFSRLSALCGKGFEGRIASPPADADANFAGKRLVMHVRQCSADTIHIPFHVGDNRSRTWIVSRLAGNGLRLKHDHRHEDGSEDILTQYGGDSEALILSTEGLLRHEFPADQFSKDLFTRQNASVSNSNVWTMEFMPGQIFAYELRRPSRFFRVEFDLTRPVAPPPPPWGTR